MINAVGRSVILIVGMLPAVTVLGESPETEALDHVRAIWEAQRTEVITAHFKYQYLMANGDSVRVPNDSQWNDLLNTLESAQSLDEWKDAFDRAFAIPTGENSLWESREFFVDDNQTRDEQLLAVQVFDGLNEVYARDVNKQVDVFHPGMSRIRRRTLKHFRYVPSASLASSLTSGGGSRGRLVLRHDGLELNVDGSTGAVLRGRQSATSNAVVEFLQSVLVTHPTGVVFPSALIEAQFRNGRLYRVTAMMTQEAEFNEALSQAVFKVAARAGTNVFDHREDHENPTHFRLPEDTQDVVRSADDAARNRGSSAPQSSGAGRFAVPIVVAGIAIATLAIVRRVHRFWSARVH